MPSLRKLQRDLSLTEPEWLKNTVISAPKNTPPSLAISLQDAKQPRKTCTQKLSDPAVLPAETPLSDKTTPERG